MSDKTTELSFEALAVANALVIKQLIGALLASGALNAEAVQAGFASAHRHLNGATLPAALVRSHPDQAAFAAEFRRFWQLAGSQHSNDANDGPGQQGIYEMLEILEEACKFPLGVRPEH